MAVDAPLLTRQRVLAAKVETTTGTAESLSASDAAFNVFNLTFDADIPMNEREGQSSLSPLPGVTGARMGKVTFETEVVGKGSSGVPSWGIFLQASGFVLSSVTYNPETGGTSPTTLTMGGYFDGRKKVIAGAVGDWTMTA